MKKILILSPFFFPEPISTGKFNTDMVLELNEEGHEVTVLCFHPFYPKWQVKESSETLEGIKIVRGGKKIKYSKKTFLRRMVLELSYAWYIIWKIIKYQKNADIVVPVFPPSLAFYVILPFLKKRIRKVGIVHDLQLIYASQRKGRLSKFVNFIISSVEKKCFKNCDKLIFLSDEMKNTAQELYGLNSNKLIAQLPFITINENITTNDLGDILSEDDHNIVYSGALSEKQNPEGMYEFFSFLTKKNSLFKCHIFSQGPVYELLRSKNQNENILFHDLVPRKNIEELYRRSTVQIVPQLPNTSKGSLPSKLPNILASGTKVLVITDKESEIEQLFLNHKLDKVITTWDKENLLFAITELINKSVNSKEQKEIAKRLFDIDNLIQKILS
ncbi:glycosyltransferase [Pseudotenacibaculum sp. MALMAid0570]|uniref:glycosyltransferase n=1 Tax=Pseudotenacibaculum sp. MALMAid0570 TaxID=3143938 RepID=UPI0032DE4577